jgi:uncharacterized protein (DUF58 family)
MAGELAASRGAQGQRRAPFRAPRRGRLRAPRQLQVTPTGRTFLVVTVGVGLGALNTGNNLLYLLLGLLLSLIVVSGVLSERSLSNLSVRRVGADGAPAKEPFAFRYGLARSVGRSFALEISEAHPLLQGAPACLAHLPAGAEVVVRAELLAPRRGPYVLSGVKVSTVFPLGLFVKSRIFDLEQTLVVHPARVAPPESVADMAHGSPGEAADPRRMGGTGEVAGLVALADGDDARRIHWARSAALGQLVRLEREREQARTFVLTVEGKGGAEAQDRECELVAARARALLRGGHQVGLVAPGVTVAPGFGPGQLRRVLHALGWVGF